MPRKLKNAADDGSHPNVSRQDELLAVLFSRLEAVIADCDDTAAQQKLLHEVRTDNNQTAERIFDPNEHFANWLTMTLGEKSVLELDEYQLEAIRREARRTILSSEIGKSVISIIKGLILGNKLEYDILSYKGTDPTDTKDAKQIEQLNDNWRAFIIQNKFERVLDSWIERLVRDGETLLRIFPTKISIGDIKNIPAVRFIDSTLIKGSNTAEGLDLGVWHDLDDYFTPTYYNFVLNGNEDKIDAKDVEHHKFELGEEMLRGISPFFPVLTNMRRFDKNTVNLSVLTAILSAIAFVRKHNNATLPQVTKFLQRSTDTSRSVNGKSAQVKYTHAGTVLDSTGGMDYQFPAHQVAADSFIKVIEMEAKLIAAPFNLPFQWLMSVELEEQITEDDPVARRYSREQCMLYSHLSSLFWNVQERMGVDPALKLKYYIQFYGPTIGAGEDQLARARANEIEQRAGTLSPQTWARARGRNYLIERRQTIKHRETRQPGEVMPGDAGNTNVTPDQPTAGQGGNGTSK